MPFSLTACEKEAGNKSAGKEVFKINYGKEKTGREKPGKRCLTAWIPRFCFVSFQTAASMAVMRMEVQASGGLFDQAESAMHTVYTDILGIATMAAVVCATVCLFLMYFSKSGRTVDESRSWLKRIVVCWIVLMLLGAIATYFQGIVSINQFSIGG